MFDNLVEKVLEKVAVKSANSTSVLSFYEPEVPKELREMMNVEDLNSKSTVKEQEDS